MVQIALPLIADIRHRHVIAVGIDGLIQTPLKDVASIGWIGLTGSSGLAEQVARALFVRGFPVRLPIPSRQFLDSAEASFNLRAILPAPNRNHISGDTGEPERIIIAAVVQSEACLALDRSDFQLPARTQPPITVPTPILET